MAAFAYFLRAKLSLSFTVHTGEKWLMTYISEVEALNPYREKLDRIGYDTLEKLIGATTGATPELAAYLGVPSLQQVITSVAGRAAMPSASAISSLRQLPCATGAVITAPGAPAVAPTPLGVPAATKADVNLLKLAPVSWPIQDQGDRGTCVAHAAIASLEYYFMTSSSFRDMSEQFLYRNCKRNDGSPTVVGTWVSVAFSLLDRDGCCEEATWQYDRAIKSGNEQS